MYVNTSGSGPFNKHFDLDFICHCAFHVFLKFHVEENRQRLKILYIRFYSTNKFIHCIFQSFELF